MTEIEDDIGKYMIETAQHWKIGSRLLLYRYRDDKHAFEKILIFVVGKGGGGVLRNVKKECFSQFSEYVQRNFSRIEKGEFDIFTVETFPEKQPISFISKICHIINPRDYPIIYDSYVKKALGIKDNKHLQQNWNRCVDEIKHTLLGKETCKELYLVDSKYWLKGSPRII